MTLLSSPPDFASVNDDLQYVVSEPSHTSDPVTYPNYKFIADVYIDSVLVARLKKAPRPDAGYGIFNISQVVKNYIIVTLNPDAASSDINQQVLEQGEFIITVQVKFGEEYSFTEYLNTLEDTPRDFYNHYNKKLLGIIKSEISAFQDAVATNGPLIREVLRSSDNYFLSYFALDNDAIDITVNTSDGGSQDLSITPDDNVKQLILLNVAPGWLNTISPGLITGITEWYTVTINDQVFTFNIICEAIFEINTLHFLNQYGGFETKIFTKLSRDLFSGEKKDFGIANYSLDNSGAVIYFNDNNVVNESSFTFASQFTKKMLINSDILTDTEYRWLFELVYSPLVYFELIDESDLYFFPVKITDNNYESKKRVNDNLTNLALTIDFGKTLNAQFR
jgi:hypothetical protein